MTKALIIILLFVLFVVVVSRFQGNQYKKFLAGAGKVTGKIVATEEKPKRADQPNRKDCFVYYSYIVDGVEYSGMDNVEYPDLWLDMKGGQEIDVYYLKDDYSKSYPVLILDRRIKASL